jgi:glycosyltransferase involved in cell wall biosynthesis
MSAASRPSLRILHVVENLERGGLERMVIDLAAAQRAAGHAVRVICLYAPGALADELTVQGIAVHACGKRAGADLSALRRLRAQLRAVPDAIVHTHNANAHYHAVAAAIGLSDASAPVRVLNTRHGMGAAHPRSRSEWLRPRRALLAVPNGIRIDAFAPAGDERRAALRCVLGLAPDTRIVGTVGRLNPVKDQRSLLQAFARVHADARDTALVLVGDGALRAALEAEAAALGIAEAVRFLGDRGDVRQLLQGFDLFALSSLSEGYSMALLEACASGLPIVATDVGGNREIVADGGNGLLVPAARPEALADALAALLRDPVRAAAMGRAGRDWALREASIDTMAARYDTLYCGEAAGA